MTDFIYAFIPIFIAMDVSGLVPVYLSLTKGFSETDRNKVALQAIGTAFLISILFIIVGRYIFKVLGITDSDFRIAGGVLLLVLAVMEMVVGEKEATPSQTVGPVPLGTPLIAGPAVLTSLLIISDLRGASIACLSLVVNLLIIYVAFDQSRRLYKLISEEGLKAISKVISLFLAAIAISMIRLGIMEFSKHPL